MSCRVTESGGRGKGQRDETRDRAQNGRTSDERTMVDSVGRLGELIGIAPALLRGAMLRLLGWCVRMCARICVEYLLCIVYSTTRPMTSAHDIDKFIQRHVSLIQSERDTEIATSSLLRSNASPRLLELKGLCLSSLGVVSINVGLGGKRCVQKLILSAVLRP